MGDPSCHSGNGEEDWVHISWEAHCPVDETGVEIDIWVEFPGNAEIRSIFTSIRLQEQFSLTRGQSR